MRTACGQPYLGSRGARRQDGPHDDASDARHRGGGPALRSRRRAARARQRALPGSRRVGGLRAGGRVELRGHRAVCVAAAARVALRVADGPGGLRLVPRTALRGGLAARLHARHRRERALGPGLRPAAAELPDRQAADAGAAPCGGGELRADPARPGPGAAGQRRRPGDHRLPGRMSAERAADRAGRGPHRRRARPGLGAVARSLPRGGRHAGPPVARGGGAGAPQPRCRCSSAAG